MPTPLKMQMTSVTVELVSREKNRKEMKREDKIITVPTDVNVSPFCLTRSFGCASFRQC